MEYNKLLISLTNSLFLIKSHFNSFVIESKENYKSTWNGHYNNVPITKGFFLVLLLTKNVTSYWICLQTILLDFFASENPVEFWWQKSVGLLQSFLSFLQKAQLAIGFELGSLKLKVGALASRLPSAQGPKGKFYLCIAELLILMILKIVNQATL